MFRTIRTQPGRPSCLPAGLLATSSCPCPRAAEALRIVFCVLILQCLMSYGLVGERTACSMIKAGSSDRTASGWTTQVLKTLTCCMENAWGHWVLPPLRFPHVSPDRACLGKKALFFDDITSMETQNETAHGFVQTNPVRPSVRPSRYCRGRRHGIDAQQQTVRCVA